MPFLLPSAASRFCPLATLVAFLFAPAMLWSEDPEDDVLAGHSFHGEAFNEGPRQAAYLMPGMGAVDFPASTEHPRAQQFINQGVAQLHGFWYYEAERSFRQAAVIDPDCAIAYWGMAMANTENRERMQGFSEEALERRKQASPREQLYIDSIVQYGRDETSKGEKIERKDRAQRFTRDLEKIVEEYPEDIEAKAFLAVQLWKNERASLPIVSHVAVDAVIQDVFDINPMHPAHHYRIHLWDRHKPERALASAAACGPSLPGVAHMWHMPGHIYDKLHRYHDAVWQQEASARVDHAHMMRDRVMPDQIHNFAHNNEWLIRNLLKIGRVEDALSLAKNMLQLPRHPSYNTLRKGSTKYGRQRLLLALSSYRLWDELIELSDTMYLEPTADERLQSERLRYLGVAYALTDRLDQADRQWAALKQRHEEAQAELEELKAQAQEGQTDPAAEEEQDDTAKAQIDKKKAKANRERREKERKDRLRELERIAKDLDKAAKSVEVALLAGRGEWEQACEKYDASDLDDKLLKAEWLMAAGQPEAALELAEKTVEQAPGQLLPLAVRAYLTYQHQDVDAASKIMAEVRELAATADLDTPLLARLTPLAVDMGLPKHWAKQWVPAEDIGGRPDLDTLGPFRWHPYLAPDFVVTRSDQQPQSLKTLRGKPRLVIFYLGFGCLHCVEQLHEFSPRAEDFRQAGIEVMAISSEKLDSLSDALESYSKPLDIPLHADPELNAFKAYRCFDDFEKQPLHGTFLIDPDGRVLWQDISYEPFMDVDFALAESKRLLELFGDPTASTDARVVQSPASE